jgi:DNA polymerase I
MSKQLVRLATDAPVPLNLQDLDAHDKERPNLKAFLEEQGFKTLLARLGHDASNIAAPKNKENTQNTSPPDLNWPPISENTYTLIQDEAVLKEVIEMAYKTGQLCFDTETTNLTPRAAKIVGVALSVEIGKAYYLPLQHQNPVQDLLDEQQDDLVQLPLQNAMELLKPILKDPSVIKLAHNAKYDLQIMGAQGIRVAPVDDTMLMSYILDGTLHGHGMDALSELFLDHKTIKYEEVAGKGKSQVTFDYVSLDKALDYAAEDAEITLRLYQLLKPRIPQEKMAVVYEDIERPLAPVIAGMESTGIKVDPLLLKSFSDDFGSQLQVLEKEIHDLAGQEFNVASPKQLGQILFENMGLQGGKKTKTGDWSTDVKTLEKLADEGTEIAQRVLEWRQLAKLKSTYTDALQESMLNETGRVHTSFSMVGTSTGRLASSDPNLQNIPIRTENGRKIREAFIAEEGHVLLSIDYSQIELRLAAEMAGIHALQDAFKQDADIHALTASQVFDVPLDEMTPEIRRRAKAINFGIIYGISGWGLAKQLGIEASEANQFIRAYMARFPELNAFMEKTKEEARTHGFVKTLYGRKCYIPGINDKNPMRKQGAERQAINAPLQGTAADIIKRAMIKLWRLQENGELGNAKMLLQVHDELIFEVPETEVEERAKQIQSVMENVAKLNTPLKTEAGWAKSWAAAH